MRQWIGKFIAMLILMIGVVLWFEGCTFRIGLPTSPPADGAQVELREEASGGDLETPVDAASPLREASAPATASEARISVSGVVVDDLGDAVADASVDLFIANGATLGSGVSTAGGTIAVEGPAPGDGSAAALRGLTIRARKDGYATCEQRVSDRSQVRLMLARP